MGGLNSFWPGPTFDIPTDLSLALSHALRVLSWQENLLEEETPPNWMWPLEWELEIWFEDIRQQREEKYGTKRDEPDDAPMMQNEFSERFRR